MPTKILMPALSPTMTEGNLVRWLKNEGDQIESGDIIAEIETDKATMEVEAVDEGKLAKILIPEGTEDVKVNSLIAVLLEEGEGPEALDGLDTSSQEASSASESAAPAEEPASALEKSNSSAQSNGQAPASPTQSGERLFASPLARRIAGQEGIELSGITGTGPRGRIVKSDVEAALASGKSIPSQAASSLSPVGPLSPRPGDGLFPAYRDEKMSNMRKVIAKRLTEAKQEVPHFYLTVDCELDTLLTARKQLNETLPDDQRISVNDFVIKATAQALKAVPSANASYIDGVMRQYETADVSVAVAVEGGLVTPIVRDADHKSLGTISSEMKELVKKARDGKLRPEEFQGGTFSISNLGMFGVKNFSAVINPPQGCILAVGAGEKRPVVRGDSLEIATVMTCTLSVDHRVVDGAVGAEFLKHFKRALENPVLMIL